MGKRDQRFDDYIEHSPEFAPPILTQIREHVHAVCPDVEETMKWSFPHFTYHGILCSMAAFKQHCTFGFWKASLITDTVTKKSTDAAGQLGRITSVKDLPDKKTMTGYVKQAMKLNEEGVTVPKLKKVAKMPTSALTVPSELATALNRNRKALNSFDAFSPSHRKEYIQWITEAKSEATRDRRIESTIAQLVEGKSRHWKYQT